MSIEQILSTSENSLLFNVFQMPFLSEEQCEELATKVLAHRYSHPHAGSMQKYTVDVTSFLSDFLNDTVKTLTPSINDLFYFGNPNEYSIYTAHAILYSANGEGEKSLGIHRDDSDITVNITLQTKNLKGCDIGFADSTEYGNTYCIENFGKLKAKLDAHCSVNTVHPTVGGCILHRGEHPHSTFSIQEGSRMALIVWLKKKLTQ
jgi:hypothetical protein